MSNLAPVVNSLAPEDVLKEIERDRDRERAYNIKLQEAAIKAEKERALLQKHIYNNANPDPHIIVAIVIAVLLALYVIYALFIKPCMSGEWADPSGNKWQIDHNNFTGNISVKINGKCAGTGSVQDNYVKYGELVGVWNYGKKIMFTKGWDLSKVL